MPADDLEAAVMDMLLNLYDDLDLFQDAIAGAYDDTENQRPRLDEELASTEAQLREVTASIDRYLRAFEAGTMPEAICAPRLAELSDRRTELSAHRDQLEVDSCQHRGSIRTSCVSGRCDSSPRPASRIPSCR